VKHLRLWRGKKGRFVEPPLKEDLRSMGGKGIGDCGPLGIGRERKQAVKVVYSKQSEKGSGRARGADQKGAPGKAPL